jgi:protein TonB
MGSFPLSGTESAPHSKKATRSSKVQKDKLDKDDISFIEEFPDLNEYPDISKPIVYYGELVYMWVDESPQFSGGEVRLMKFIRQNLKYPDMDRRNGVQGIVVVKFIVYKSGKVGNAHVLRHVSPTIDAEALRVVNLLPNFIPGKQNGASVSTLYTLPIRFRLPK